MNGVHEIDHEPWSFSHPTRVFWGRESLQQLNELSRALCDGSLAILVGSHAAAENGYLRRLEESLSDHRLEVFAGVEPEPTHSTVMRVKSFVEERGAKGVVALGGGSVLDAAKAVCCIAYTDSDITTYMDRVEEFTEKQIPLVALPTTAGTGSEVTPFSVLTNEETGEKKSLPSPFFYADLAVVIPDYLATVPPKVIGDTGLDALAHAYEALWSVNANPVSDALAFKAIKLITASFEAYYKDPRDAVAAGDMAKGATIAGMAFSNTLTAGCHALSYPIGRIFGLSHGASCAMTLHLIAELNAPVVAGKFDQLAAYLGLESGSEIPESIRGLREGVNTIPTLNELGARRGQLEEVAAGAFQPLLKNNPVTMTDEVIVALLEPEIA